MNPFDERKLLVERILSYLNNPPADIVQQLLRKSITELETILGDTIANKARAEASERAKQYAAEMRRESKFEAAWTHSLMQTWLNGKRLVDVQANRDMLESMLNPGEEPSAAIYATIAKQFPQKFTWETPRPIQSDKEREAEFVKICRENFLSLCAANQQLHKDGVGIEHWAGASEVERQRFQAEVALARQKHLIHNATPDELKAEANYQFQSEHAAAVREDAERREKFVAEAQRGLYPPLPAVNGRGEPMDAANFRKISTVDYPLFKALVKRHGSSQITARLRGEN